MQKKLCLGGGDLGRKRKLRQGPCYLYSSIRGTETDFWIELPDYPRILRSITEISLLYQTLP